MRKNAETRVKTWNRAEVGSTSGAATEGLSVQTRGQQKQVEADVEDCKLIPPRVAWQNLPLFEIALVLVRFDHVARLIVNANYST